MSNRTHKIVQDAYAHPRSTLPKWVTDELQRRLDWVTAKSAIRADAKLCTATVDLEGTALAFVLQIAADQIDTARVENESAKLRGNGGSSMATRTGIDMRVETKLRIDL